ncbi:ImmA/IrrE family metallo-endopeptidase [Caloramator sp. mosi_1]|uniref:ImmA/IrrE family metallo-endopeptidase n=1 Tax=Caloramator sp. mosi_1 TaxID=3023090 RepID=UPI00235E00A6|nr:ImmA/IrrE family metallo-endopeptidase [Caloramator sp. mosi_1]WDC83378.1 ImmA/IrrE family metallo-endopeptidase [Caloramator sp. mosi_1]
MEPVICCRTSSIENFEGKKQLITPEDFREHQADYFAAAIAMPKSTFIPLANKILKDKGINNGKVVTGIDSKLDKFAEYEFPNKIAEAYGVSKKQQK